MEPGEIVAELWRGMQARDWDAVWALLADDFVLDWPNARIRIRGRTNFVGFNRSYPEGWSIEVIRIVAAGSLAVSEVRVPHPTVGPYYALSFFEIVDGKIARGREYWVEERHEEVAPDRARWFEAM
ncbi:MAG: nuclear transport factor 2 family protein [Candidatus Dormiibacterota bacterium]